MEPENGDITSKEPRIADPCVWLSNVFNDSSRKHLILNVLDSERSENRILFYVIFQSGRITIRYFPMDLGPRRGMLEDKTANLMVPHGGHCTKKTNVFLSQWHTRNNYVSLTDCVFRYNTKVTDYRQTPYLTLKYSKIY